MSAAACAVLLLVAGARVPAQSLPGVAAPAAAPRPVDPLGRDTPAGTLGGFSAAVHEKDFVTAARYLQLGRRTGTDAEALARDLSELLDRYFVSRLNSLSTSPDGTVNDGLSADLERLPLQIGDRPVDLFLTRVSDPEAGAIWLVSSESLAKVPELHRLSPATVVEQIMPQAWVVHTFLGLSLAQWILWALSIVIPLLVFWSIGLLLGRIVKRSTVDPSRRAVAVSWWKGVRRLLVVGFTLGTHLTFLPLLGFSLTFRFVYTTFARIVGVVIFALLVWRVLTVSFHHARLLALRRGRSDTRSLLMLGERVVKVLVVASAMLLLLSLMGVNTSTALAGVGIFGVALALGAQKSIENLLGGIFLLTDKVLAVGDFCKVSDRTGWIEDVTLRSVRLRTMDQTLLSVPAGMLAQGGIENFATRNKILIESVLRLRYGASTTQLHAVLDGIRQLLAGHPLVEQEGARIRLIGFGVQAIELELFAYLKTPDFDRFLAERENILLTAAAIIEAAGCEFAAPTQFVYMRGEPSPETAPVDHEHGPQHRELRS